MKKLIRIFWETYAVFYLFFVVTSIIGDLSDSKLQLIDNIDTIVSLPSLVAVVGWAWKKYIGTLLYALNFTAMRQRNAQSAPQADNLRMLLWARS